ncbi:MAG: hypothetical protein JJE01_04170 [Gemmatimonadetes bacterium]|nr:hypothetical protein [Gemmatimonadota bacterium]
MRAMKILAVPLLAGCLFLACDEASSPTAVSETDAVELQANFMNGPEEAGVVYRHQGDFMWVDVIETTPQEEPWVFFFGEQMGEVPWSCGGTRTGLVSWQDVKSKNLGLSKNYPVVAYRMAEFFPLYMEGADLGEDPYCYAALRAEQIAGGVTKLTTHDDGPQGWRSSVNGTVDWEGETYQLHYMLQFRKKEIKSSGKVW